MDDFGWGNNDFNWGGSDNVCMPDNPTNVPEYNPIDLRYDPPGYDPPRYDPIVDPRYTHVYDPIRVDHEYDQTKEVSQVYSSPDPSYAMTPHGPIPVSTDHSNLDKNIDSLARFSQTGSEASMLACITGATKAGIDKGNIVTGAEACAVGILTGPLVATYKMITSN